MHAPDAPLQDLFRIKALDALSIVAIERQNLHEKILRLRALREAAAMVNLDFAGAAAASRAYVAIVAPKREGPDR
jgi:hypothetical protein